MAIFKDPIRGEDLNDIKDSVDLETTYAIDNARHSDVISSLAEIIRELKELNQIITFLSIDC